MQLALTSTRPRKRPTWLGWLLIAITILILSLAALFNLYPFLAPEQPPHKGVMVVEGWIHDFALDEAVTIFNRGGYDKIICTGIQIETGSYIQQFESYPEMTAARLRKMGVPDEKIIVTVAADAKKDRTYLSAVALREAFIAYNLEEHDLHLITVGPHGRRSRMLFQKALGPDFRIGVTSLDPTFYDASDWYRCSEGVRAVIGELIAYTYAQLFFHP